MIVWDSVNGQYRSIIESYKKQINGVQQDFETDMETAENMVQFTRNRVTKCKDDLSHAQETVKMFKRRVQEVLDKIAQQKEFERVSNFEILKYLNIKNLYNFRSPRRKNYRN